MNNNKKTILHQIANFSKENLNCSNEPIDLFHELCKKNLQMVNNTQKPELLAAAITYSYLRANGLNGKGGITTKELASFFSVKPQAITQKVFDVDCIINPEVIFPENEYEFVDIDRFKVSMKYYDFLESPEADDYKKSEKILLSFIDKDPHFFDPYTVLHEYYLENGKGTKAYNLMEKGYNRAIKLITKKGKFPDILHWGFIENRHIIRLLFNFAALLWLSKQKEEALEIFMNLLHSNPNDNIGARFAIVGLLDGFNNIWEMEEKFNKGNGYLDWEKQEEWFEKLAHKHKDKIGWWLDLVEDESQT